MTADTHHDMNHTMRSILGIARAICRRTIANLARISLPMAVPIIPLLIGGLHAAEKPNIVLILADDLGYADVGFTGCTDIQTPNLDKLAASGVTFTRGYVSHPFCAPSRAGLLAGRYQQRFGFENNPAFDPANPLLGIDPKETLFPQRLQKVGYVTGGFGKWHVGSSAPYHPNKRGFDYFYGFLGGGHDYFQIDLTQRMWEGYSQGLIRNEKPATFDGYLTTALTRDAVRFVEQHHEQPFFLYLAYNAPHGPLQAPEEDIARYADIPDERRRIYAAMVDVMDRGIGDVISALEKHGLRENTLVFFLSDNGGPLPTPERPQGGNASSNGQFRDGKGSLYEGGVHVPFIASWPARIPAGTRYENPVIALDIARTAVEHAGGDSKSGHAMEGVDLIPFVLGEQEGPPHEALFWRAGSDQRWAVLNTEGTKAMQNQPDAEIALYSLPDDVSEKNNLAAAQPERLNELQEKWNAWNKGNVPLRFLGYKQYQAERNKWFRQMVPAEARKKPALKPGLKR